MSNCTIVVPCYNEAARLDVDAFRQFSPPGCRLRFLFVNDGSTDETATVLEDLARRDTARFAVCHLSKNCGKAEAVRQGIVQAMEDGPEYVGFWDADLATPLDLIPEFCDRLEASPDLLMVFGARVKLLGRTIERRAVRHYLGRVFATAASTVLRLPIYDTQCGAKIFRASPAIRSLFERPFRTNWIFDVELLARYRRVSLANTLQPLENAIYELPLTEWRDVAGSKVKPLDFFKAFFELARIYLTYLRPGLPKPAPLSSSQQQTEDSADQERRAA